jgi:chromate transport protein ChrA
MFRFLGKMAIVGVAHSAVGIALYCGMVRGRLPVLGAEFLAFTMPAILAFCAYFLIAWYGPLSAARLRWRICLAALIAFLALLVSFSCFAVVAFNTWGS